MYHGRVYGYIYIYIYYIYIYKYIYIRLVPRSHAKGKKVQKTTWAFKVKRYPDGLTCMRKLKARFCVRGDLQEEGVDYFDVYAPLVQWSTVRMVMTMSQVM